jgi:hypothetical protein
MHAVSGIRTHDPRIRAALDRTAPGTSLINHSCLIVMELTIGVIRSRGYESSSSVMKPSLTAEVLVPSKFVSRLNRRSVHLMAYPHLISRWGKNEFTQCPSRNLPSHVNFLTGILQNQRFSHKVCIDIKQFEQHWCNQKCC